MPAGSRLDLGHYEAARAAALAGVPVSTLYDWARQELIEPSISATREKLWSYGDLLTLRLVRWLRTDKPDAAHTTMREVRKMLETIGDALWIVDEAGIETPTVRVTRAGEVIRVDRPAETVFGQRTFESGDFDLFGPTDTGPDLRVPRPRLRIVPGKVSGEPHLAHSRLRTQDVAALARSGFELAEIHKLYPDEHPEALREAIEFENVLAG